MIPICSPRVLGPANPAQMTAHWQPSWQPSDSQDGSPLTAQMAAHWQFSLEVGTGLAREKHAAFTRPYNIDRIEYWAPRIFAGTIYFHSVYYIIFISFFSHEIFVQPVYWPLANCYEW